MQEPPAIDAALSDSLPVFSRLALSYAPRRARAPTLALMALDARLASVLRAAREPLMAQLRLSWWREALAVPPGQRPAAEPLLSLLDHWHAERPALLALVDGWEELTGDAPLPASAMAAFADARAQSFAGLARILDQRDAQNDAARCARGWALADLATRLNNADEGDAVQALAESHDWKPVRLPRCLRPLAVLHGLAARQTRRGERLDRAGAGALFVAMRIGLAGR